MATQKSPTKSEEKMQKALDAVPLETERLLELMNNHLLEAEGNFLDLYDVVVERLSDEAAKRKLREFRGDHARHVTELRGVLDHLQADFSTETGPNPTRLAQGMKSRLRKVHDDKALVMEFLASEDFSRRLYQWASMMDAPEPLARVLQRAVDDENTHYEWAAKYCGIDPMPL